MISYNKIENLVINSETSENWCASGLGKVQLQCINGIQLKHGKNMCI